MAYSDGAPGRATTSGKRFERIEARDYATQHNGDKIHIMQNYASQTDEAGKEKAWIDALLGWLTFAEIYDRREQVREAWKETYQWIFAEDSPTGFVPWLRSGESVYWVKGKPASGKSTLMKFISDEPRLRENLDVWSGDRPLIVGSFWFWAAGTQLQRSLLGLYRALLYQMLRNERPLCRTVFPNWQIKFTDRDPTIETLRAAMRIMLAQSTIVTKFLFVIDGLDEYESDSVGKADLASLVLQMAQSPNAKFVLSSRPETPFEIEFRQCPMLRLETLTENDVRTYVEERLKASSCMRELTDAEAKGMRDITQYILCNASGVFLWVALVVNIVLNGINDLEDILVIRDRVMSLPPELDSLFAHILAKRIPQHHRQEAFRYLLIALAWETSDTADAPKNIIVATAIQASSYEKSCYLARSDRKLCKPTDVQFPERLASRCRGLLEVTKSSTVVFLHRTLLDYLKQEEKAKALLTTEVGDTFDVNTAIMAGLVCNVCTKWEAAILERDQDYDDYLMRDRIRNFLHLNVLAERSTGQHRRELVAIFDKVIERLCTPRLRDGHWSRSLPDMIPAELQSEGSLLSLLVLSGGKLYMQEAIRRREVIEPAQFSVLLHFTIPFDRDDKYRWDINGEAMELLLQHGADPSYILDKRQLWPAIFQSFVRTFADPDEVLVWLNHVILLAKYASYPQKQSRFTMGTDYPNKYTAFEVIRNFILERECCDEHAVTDCYCDRAQDVLRLTQQVQQLLKKRKRAKAELSLEPPQDGCFPVLGIKRLLPVRLRSRAQDRTTRES